jgi:hypothetical protein
MNPLRIGVEILFTERRWVDRIEQLFQLCDVDFDHLAGWRDWIAGGLRGLTHSGPQFEASVNVD